MKKDDDGSPGKHLLGYHDVNTAFFMPALATSSAPLEVDSFPQPLAHPPSGLGCFYSHFL